MRRIKFSWFFSYNQISNPRQEITTCDNNKKKRETAELRTLASRQTTEWKSKKTKGETRTIIIGTRRMVPQGNGTGRAGTWRTSRDYAKYCITKMRIVQDTREDLLSLCFLWNTFRLSWFEKFVLRNIIMIDKTAFLTKKYCTIFIIKQTNKQI